MGDGCYETVLVHRPSGPYRESQLDRNRYSIQEAPVLRALPLLALVLLLSGCYHATVNTGIAPGTRTIEEPWAKSFVYGLVPPDAVDAMAECGSDGVARVETRISFLNGLVSALTLSIFTPMEITVTCGAGEEEDSLETVTDAESLEKALKDGGAFLVPVGSL